MDNILLIQMARIGDLLQTTPLMYGVKKKYPHARLSVLIDAEAQEIVANNQYIDEILPLPMSSIAEFTLRQQSLDELYGSLKHELYLLHEQNFDMVINVNSSMLSTILNAITGCDNVYGYGFSKLKKKIIKNQWFYFFNTIVKYEPLSPFNLVDYFYYLTGSVHDHPGRLFLSAGPANRSRAGKLLHAQGIHDGTVLIAVQLATRNMQRQWPVEYFAELVAKLLAHDTVHILLLGSRAERGLAGRFLKVAEKRCTGTVERVHDITGKTSLSEVAALLEKTDLLITGDTGTMHVAASVNCRVLGIFFGPAFCHETGPYGLDNWVIQARSPCAPCNEGSALCSDYACRKEITPDIVCAVAKHMLFDEPITMSLPDNIELLKTAQDTYGIIHVPAFKKAVTMEDIHNACYRHMGSTLFHETQHCAHATKINNFFTFSRNSDKAFTDALQHTVTTAEALLFRYRRDPRAAYSALIEEDTAFWHPWIDFCHQWLKGSDGDEQVHVSSVFQTGISNGMMFLKNIQQHLC